MVLASPDPLLTPPRYGNPTPPSPGGSCSSRRGRGMGGQNQQPLCAGQLHPPGLRGALHQHAYVLGARICPFSPLPGATRAVAGRTGRMLTSDSLHCDCTMGIEASQWTLQATWWWWTQTTTPCVLCPSKAWYRERERERERAPSNDVDPLVRDSVKFI